MGTSLITARGRVSERTTNACMWPEHVCMKGLCNALNNQFTTLMWHIWLTKWSIIPHGGSRLGVYCRTAPPHNPTTTQPHSEACQTFSAMNMWPKECRVKCKKTEIIRPFLYIDWFPRDLMCKNQIWATCAPKWVAKSYVSLGACFPVQEISKYWEYIFLKFSKSKT